MTTDESFGEEPPLREVAVIVADQQADAPAGPHLVAEAGAGAARLTSKAISRIAIDAGEPLDAAT